MLSPQEKVLILIHHSTGQDNCRQTRQDNCRLIQQRQQYFQKLTGFPYHDGDFARFIREQASEPVQALWKLITTQLSECKTQNELNGRIISIQKKNTEQILQILTGQSANTTQTYSHLGQTSQQKKAALYTSV